jgi:hypothetical protein
MRYISGEIEAGSLFMFCPNCGRDNARELKFCVSCGTNLLVVSKALSDSESDFWNTTDAAIDNFIARYSERVFKAGQLSASERNISNSWKILGRGVLTSFVDVILFNLMWSIFPLRFFMLMIMTPVRVLLRRTEKQKGLKEVEGKGAVAFPDALPDKWLQEPIPSVSERTTENLAEYKQARQDRVRE